MTTAEYILKHYWRELFPPKRFSLLNGSVGKATGIDYKKLPERLSKFADSLERIERFRKVVEAESKKNPNGLPF